jgi:Predicted lactoylglutathione lyase
MMNIKTTVVCLPVRNIERTLAFYKNALGFSEAVIEEGMVTLELPNLSLFLMEKEAFEIYSRKVGRGAQFPDDNAGMVISCALETREAVDAILEKAVRYEGTVPDKAALDRVSGSYIGYFADPDGHLWELVYPRSMA